MTAATDLPDSTKLAVERTRLAHERTLMAWVRTGTSLISFGFTIYKFFDYMRENRTAPERLFGPREFALVMIATGVVALILATIEHRFSMKRLREQYGALVPRSLALVIACLIASLGVLGLLAVVFRQ